MVGFRESHIRLCGGRWVFCDGNCAYCVETNTITTTNTTTEFTIDSNGKVVKIGK